MSIDDIKRALIEVKNFCEHNQCYKCPFSRVGRDVCRLSRNPLNWAIDDWGEGVG